VALYYGTRMEPHVPELARLAAPTIMHFSEHDPHVPLSTVDAIRTAVAALPRVAIHVYDGAEHAFARPHHAPFDAAATALARRHATGGSPAAGLVPAAVRLTRDQAA